MNFDRDLNLLTKYYNSVVDILRNRGYEAENKTKEEIRKMGEEGLDVVVYNGMVVSYNLLFTGTRKNAIDRIINIIDSKYKEYAAILIYSTGTQKEKTKEINSATKDEIKSRRLNTTEFISDKRLLIPINHYFQPKFKLLKNEEMKEVCRAYFLMDTKIENDKKIIKYEPKKCPLIFSSDPVVEYFGFPHNRLLMIRRGDKSIYYRYINK